MTQAALLQLISIGEGQNLEFKQTLPDDLGREACAFANSAGGKILIGVADNGSLKPLANLNRLVSRVQDHSRNCEPPVPVDVQVVAGVIVVDVRPSRDKPHSSKGLFYLREGANTQRMSRTQIKEFFFKEGLLYYDAAVNPQFRLDRDLLPARYAAFVRDAGIDPSLDMVDTLRNIALLTDEGITNAGCLVLGQKIERFMISATVTCALFQGGTKTKILDQKVFDDDIASNYRSALLYLQSHLNTEYIIGATREQKLELPEAALREALINALAHRDYRSGTNVQIYIFADRVEIVNPGGLVGGLELKDLGRRSAPRNPLLFGTLYRMKLVEHVGSGIRRIREALANDGLPEPVLDVDEYWFSIIFRRVGQKSSPTGSPTSSPTVPKKRTELIFGHIHSNLEISVEELASLSGIGERAVKKHIATLKAEGRLKRVGGTFGGRWEVLD